MVIEFFLLVGSEMLDYKIEIEVRIYDWYGDFVVFYYVDIEVWVSFVFVCLLICLCNLFYLGCFNLIYFILLNEIFIRIFFLDILN